MAKEVTHAVRFDDPFQTKFDRDKQKFVVACDDGSIYEFQKMADEPSWNLRARGSRGEHDVHWTQSRAKLPKNVIETLDEILGPHKWKK